MDAPTISFDDQTGIAPHEVGHHPDAVDNQMAIDLEGRKTRLTEEREDSFLEFPASILFARIVMGDG